MKIGRMMLESILCILGSNLGWLYFDLFLNISPGPKTSGEVN